MSKPQSPTDSRQQQSSEQRHTRMRSSPGMIQKNPVYEARDVDDTDARESSRLNPITATLLNTISQDNLFLTCLVIVEILGCCITLLCYLWVQNLGGFGFSHPNFGLSNGDIVFNWHPFLMLLGMVFLNANGKLLLTCFIV